MFIYYYLISKVKAELVTYSVIDFYERILPFFEI